MILGIGSDIVQIPRIEQLLVRFGERFEARLFTQGEQAKARSRANPAASYAKRFAAKEAAAKALGSGLRDGMRWPDFEVINDVRGAPSLLLHGAARARLDAITPPGMRAVIHVTLSDDDPLAQAWVLIEARPAGADAAAAPHRPS